MLAHYATEERMQWESIFLEIHQYNYVHSHSQMLIYHILLDLLSSKSLEIAAYTCRMKIRRRPDVHTLSNYDNIAVAII